MAMDEKLSQIAEASRQSPRATCGYQTIPRRRVGNVPKTLAVVGMAFFGVSLMAWVVVRTPAVGAVALVAMTGGMIMCLIGAFVGWARGM